MSNYTDVRKEAKKRGPLSSENTNPILIQPSKSYVISRLITAPMYGTDGRRLSGRYIQIPAIITVQAFNAGEASARADEIQYNKREELWGQGSKPWTSDGRTSWRETEVPPDTKPLILK